MTFLQIFLIASIVVHAVIGMMWSAHGLVNVLCKLTFIALAIAAGVLLGAELGFIVKV